MTTPKLAGESVPETWEAAWLRSVNGAVLHRDTEAHLPANRERTR